MRTDKVNEGRRLETSQCHTAGRQHRLGPITGGTGPAATNKQNVCNPSSVTATQILAEFLKNSVNEPDVFKGPA